MNETDKQELCISVSYFYYRVL